MRINPKRLKRQRHHKQIKLPAAIKKRFYKSIVQGNVPNDQQIKMAVSLGLVNKNDQGHLEAKSLAKYFETFIKQRQADDERQNHLR